MLTLGLGLGLGLVLTLSLERSWVRVSANSSSILIDYIPTLGITDPTRMLMLRNKGRVWVSATPRVRIRIGVSANPLEDSGWEGSVLTWDKGL